RTALPWRVDGAPLGPSITKRGQSATVRCQGRRPEMAIDANQDITVVADTRSAYERIGGGPAVKELVDRFYERVLADRQLARYFTTDMKRLKWHQATLLTSLLGGPDAYEGRELSVAHHALRIRRRHYDRVAV